MGSLINSKVTNLSTDNNSNNSSHITFRIKDNNSRSSSKMLRYMETREISTMTSSSSNNLGDREACHRAAKVPGRTAREVDRTIKCNNKATP